MPSNGPTAKAYPTEKQYENWKDHAEELGMSISQFIQNMTETGRKTFDTFAKPDDTRIELREQRNDLRHELESARNRISKLEDKLYYSEQQAIREYVQENPGVTWGEIIQHLMDTTDERALDHLDAMEGESIHRGSDDGFYPMKGNE